MESVAAAAIINNELSNRMEDMGQKVLVEFINT